MLTRCAAAVGQCGYNTAIDWLQAGVPGVFVPFAEAGEVEQTLRAGSLQRALRLRRHRRGRADPAEARRRRRGRRRRAGALPSNGLKLDGAAQTSRMRRRVPGAPRMKQELLPLRDRARALARRGPDAAALVARRRRDSAHACPRPAARPRSPSSARRCTWPSFPEPAGPDLADRLDGIAGRHRAAAWLAAPQPCAGRSRRRPSSARTARLP